METLTIIAIVSLVVLVYVLIVYNSIIAMIEGIKNDLKQIDVQLDRRHKVFTSLVNSVKKYMDHEKTTLKEVTALRSQAEKAGRDGDMQAKIMAENRLSSIASGLSVMVESYPDLKADQNVMQLQEEIVSTENKLAFSKQAYNDGIEAYNAYKKSLPQNLIVARFASKLDVDFVYWGLTEEDAKKKEGEVVTF